MLEFLQDLRGVNNKKVKGKPGLKRINLKADPFYLLTAAVISVSLFFGYMYFSRTKDIGNMKINEQNMAKDIAKKKKEVTELKRKVREFNEKIESLPYEFLPPKSQFGIYSLMQKYDDYKKYIKFDYKLDQVEDSLVGKYKYHNLDFVIQYTDDTGFKNIFSILRGKYFMDFVEGSYQNGAFNLKYKIFVYDDNENK